MKRATPVLLAILLGALASGIGVGIFLKFANDDRNRLASELEAARKTAEAAEADKEKLAREANEKVEEANAEVLHAQDVLNSLKEEQEQIVLAKTLRKPATYEIRGWKSVLSFHQEVGLFLPGSTEVEMDSGEALLAVKQSAKEGPTQDTRWLSVTPYAPSAEAELTGSFTTSTSLSYLIDGRLVTGRKGAVRDTGEQMLVLRVRKDGESTHLIWIKDPGTLGSGNGFERLLSTFEFNS